MKQLLIGAALALSVSILAFAQDQGQPQGGHGAFQQACGNDFKTCASAQSREDRHACIEANKDKFSDACKTFLSSHAGHWHRQGGGGQGGGQ